MKMMKRYIIWMDRNRKKKGSNMFMCKIVDIIS